MLEVGEEEIREKLDPVYLLCANRQVRIGVGRLPAQLNLVPCFRLNRGRYETDVG